MSLEELQVKIDILEERVDKLYTIVNQTITENKSYSTVNKNAKLSQFGVD